MFSYDMALRSADPDWKAIAGKAGIAGNLASNAAFESTRPLIPTSEELARSQAPFENPSLARCPTKASPSNVPNVIFFHIASLPSRLSMKNCRSLSLFCSLLELSSSH